jgi:molybdopterin-containing oxidoreductase family iron-sulfur binding subunit
MGWGDGDFVRVENGAASVELPVYRQAGMLEGVVAAHLGYGRRFNGRLGNNVGVSFANFTASSTAGALPSRVVTGVRCTKTGRSEKLPGTQGHHSLEGREIIFDTTLEEYRKDPASGIVREFPAGKNPPNIWSGFEYKGYRWGMSIDLSSCTGCSACVVACSVENNVPAVGKDQVQKNREMQWIRIDRYYSGDPAEPDTVLQPMLCQHCENAPCETVCPVVATVHSDEGLNQMIYNRCVGTKYCSNNCPYKVRRFNWFNNNGEMNGPLEHPIPLSKNPEVTLRSRGVMEKCTFCTQRIEAGKSQAKSQGRRVNDQDIRTACQEACPADAIVFGDTNNPESRVSKLKANPRGFLSLEELNARPQVTYLTKVRNRAAHAGKE